MKAYEDLLYEQWRQQVEATLPTLLKKNLLAISDFAAAASSSVKSASSSISAETADKTDHSDGGIFIFIIYFVHS